MCNGQVWRLTDSLQYTLSRPLEDPKVLIAWGRHELALDDESGAGWRGDNISLIRENRGRSAMVRLYGGQIHRGT
jgi:hypothetical protein